MEQGWDPDVKRFFRKILNSLSLGLMWLIAAIAAGLYHGLAYRGDVPLAYNIIFYVLLLATFLLLLRYLYVTWRK